MITLREAASGLLNAVESAIQSGDWKVDGACDPTVEIIRLKNILAKPVKESFNPSTNLKEAFNLDRGCWERGCIAYDTRDCDDGVTVYVDAVNISQERVDETVKHEHEPFIYVREDNEKPFGGYEHCSEADAGAFPVYTAPPKREWVGLTDEERSALEDKYKHIETGWRHDADLISETEAKLKEKNT